MLFAELDANLNALTNFHYTPNVAQEDLTVIANIPSIRMEEATPIAFTNASRLAPEEILSVFSRSGSYYHFFLNICLFLLWPEGYYVVIMLLDCVRLVCWLKLR